MMVAGQIGPMTHQAQRGGDATVGAMSGFLEFDDCAEPPE